MDLARAARLNQRYMKQYGWRSSVDRIVQLLGFKARSPGEWEFAEGVARWQKSNKLVSDGIIGPRSWSKMKSALAKSKDSQRQTKPPAPQTFAAVPAGTVPIDFNLVARNQAIERNLLRAAENYLAQKDFRWFFTYAHGQITKQINQSIQKFQRPNALMRLNIHFAEQFLRAIDKQPHAGWERAFKTCEALQQGAEDNALLMGEVEFCGAAMASIHIHLDLAAALKEVGCIPPQDYGNMLVFVERGSLAALVRLRGRVVGAGEAMLEKLIAPVVKLEVKVWRNTVYTNACNMPVPDPVSTFL